MIVGDAELVALIDDELDDEAKAHLLAQLRSQSATVVARMIASGTRLRSSIRYPR